MAENFYTDNQDIRFQLMNVGLDEVVRLRENDYTQAATFPDAPEDLADALDSYDKVLEMIGEICGDKIAPRAADVDAMGASIDNNVVTYAPGTYENLRDLTQAQVMGTMLPRQYGGLNYPVSVYTMMTEMVSRADASLQNLFGLQDIAETLCKFADEDQKQRYLPGFCTGEYDGAMSLTEPEAGSDLQAVQLKAWQDETGQWYLNGMKRFITNGCAKIHLVLARSEAGTRDGRGLSMFVCKAGPELVVRRIEDKMGIHGSPTCELQFNDVPCELVGQRRRGLTRYVMSLMNGARVAISAQALGIAEAATRQARKYATERTQFGKPIIKLPAVYEMLTWMKVQVIAARALLYETTKYVDLRDVYEELNKHDENPTAGNRNLEKLYVRMAAELTPLCKAFCTELANTAAYMNIQIHGGTGFMRDFPAERLYRDARITNIYEGTTQLQYVAAIGGVVQRVLDDLMDGFAALPFERKLRRLLAPVEMARERLLKAIKFVESKNDSDYFDLMAGRICQMETFVLTSLLLLRDARIDKQREVVAECFITDGLAKFNAHEAIVMEGNFTVVDSHEDILSI
ncbi:MAG: acyl-CoA dehydrogenase family protein [Lentisphaeria bacterium]|nr:acyl-CoA dehydrogenase family protein [Lentisphaeria bacterium]